MIGQIAVAQENRVTLMLSLGKSLLRFDKVDSFKEIVKQIESVSADDIHQLARELFQEQELSQLSFVPS